MSRASRRRAAALFAGVCVGAASMAALALWATGREESSVLPGRPPWTVAGIVLCRGPFDLAGYLTADGSVVYPITHPKRPSLDRGPARCFASYQQAEEAGFRVAPAPPGTTVVGRVYLVPAPKDVSVPCRAADRKLSFRSPCPALVPAGAAWSCGPCVVGGTFVLSGVANAPAGYAGVSGGGLHLVIAASKDARSERLGCVGGRPDEALRLKGGLLARLMRCPVGSALHSGHLLARWADDGVSYAASLHGSDSRNRALLHALIASLREGR